MTGTASTPKACTTSWPGSTVWDTVASVAPRIAEPDSRHELAEHAGQIEPPTRVRVGTNRE